MKQNFASWACFDFDDGTVLGLQAESGGRTSRKNFPMDIAKDW
jgi:hypothetical protein